MGRFKPLMNLGGKTVLERVVSLYRNAGIRDVRVVTGFRSAAIESALAARPVSVVHNPDYAKGMFSSVQAGVKTLSADSESFFVHPVDIPLVRPHTLKMLMVAFQEHPSTVVYALFDDIRGHPPLIRGKLKAAILSYDGNGGLRDLLRRFDSTALDVQVADQGVLLDLDTPDDFQCMATRLTTSARLTRQECQALMAKVQKLPGPLIDHCQCVAQVAETLANAVNNSGGTLDVRLIRSAALVHDATKFENNHAATGADLLAEMGFPAMATIVEAHMDIDVSERSPLDEVQIVYLADKLMEGNRVMNLTTRFDIKLGKFDRDPTAFEMIDRRRQAAMTIQAKVEQTTNKKIRQLLQKIPMVNGNQKCAIS
jgi:CTP:molybdopterin cytidylyltransferase MocA